MIFELLDWRQMLKILNHRDLPRKTHLKLKIHECRVGLTLDLRERRFYLALSRIDMIWIRRWKFYVMIPPKNEKYNLLGTWAEIEGFQFPVGRSQNGTGFISGTDSHLSRIESEFRIFIPTQADWIPKNTMSLPSQKQDQSYYSYSFLPLQGTYIYDIYFFFCNMHLLQIQLCRKVSIFRLSGRHMPSTVFLSGVNVSLRDSYFYCMPCSSNE